MKLTPVEALKVKPDPKRKKGSWLGSMKGKIWISPDFDADNEEIGRLMEGGSIFPTDND